MMSHKSQPKPDDVEFGGATNAVSPSSDTDVSIVTAVTVPPTSMAKIAPLGNDATVHSSVVLSGVNPFSAHVTNPITDEADPPESTTTDGGVFPKMADPGALIWITTPAPGNGP